MLTKLEMKRQVLHILFGVTIVSLLLLDILTAEILFTIFIIGLIISYFSRKEKIPIIYHFLKVFDREKDIKEFPGKGVIFYILGSFLAVTLFDKDIAMASIMILAFGDSISRLMGPYGYLKHPFHSEKFIEGVIAGAIAGFFGALVFVSILEAALGSIFAMLIESLDLRANNFKIDDNLTIPIIAGFVMWLIRSFAVF